MMNNFNLMDYNGIKSNKVCDQCKKNESNYNMYLGDNIGSIELCYKCLRHIDCIIFTTLNHR